jgi:hypothetical protein
VRQENERPKTNVEVWIEQFNIADLSTATRDRRIFETSELYKTFRRFEDDFFPGDRTNIAWFGRYLAQVPKCPFEKMAKHGCQSALNIDPLSASKTDPPPVWWLVPVV